MVDERLNETERTAASVLAQTQPAVHKRRFTHFLIASSSVSLIRAGKAGFVIASFFPFKFFATYQMTMVKGMGRSGCKNRTSIGFCIRLPYEGKGVS